MCVVVVVVGLVLVVIRVRALKLYTMSFEVLIHRIGLNDLGLFQSNSHKGQVNVKLISLSL